MILSNMEFVSVGGGDGKFGLWFDAALERGYSSSCSTFRNEVLTEVTGTDGKGEKEGKFEIVAVECWAVG